MRKIWFLLCLLPCSVFAQSTCETRVDAHQQATTRQRVAYCLIPSYGSSETNRPGVVFSGVSTQRKTVPAAKASTPTAHDGSFHPGSVEVTRNYVGSRRFPQVKSDRLSEYEKFSKRETMTQGQEVAAQAVQDDKCEIPEEYSVEPQPVTQPAQAQQEKSDTWGGWVEAAFETSAGVRARKQKPQRRNMQTESEQQAPAAPVTAQTLMGDDYSYTEYEPYAPAGEETIPSGTQSYAPAGEEPIAQGTQSYAPAGEEPIAQGTQSYAPAGEEIIPSGTQSYAPAD